MEGGIHENWCVAHPLVWVASVFRMSLSEEVEEKNVLEVVVRSDSATLLDHIHVDVRRSASTNDVEQSPKAKERKARRAKELVDKRKSIQVATKTIQHGKPKDATYLSTVSGPFFLTRASPLTPQFSSSATIRRPLRL